MKLNILLTTALIACGTIASAADKSAPMDAKSQEMMKKYQEASTPGEAHKTLAEAAGKWKTEVSTWQTADAKPEVNKGTATFKMILGGRWLQQDFKASMMGQKYEGLGLIGFDNVKQKYVTNWHDSMSTGTVHTEGDLDAGSKTIKDKGVASCPISASKTQEIRNDWQMVSKNKMIYSMYGKGPSQSGAEFKMMEIVYTR